MVNKIRTVLNPLALLALLAAACATGGCQQGAVQAAFYTDGRNHFPRADVNQEMYFLFKEGEQEILHIDWQDIPILNISVPRVQRMAYAPLHTDLFDVRVESLVEPKTAQTFTVRESEGKTLQLPGVGAVYVDVDATHYGKARLDKLCIDFTPEFLERVRSKVSPPQQEGDQWSFKRRTIASDARTTEPSGKGFYKCDAAKRLDMEPGQKPTIDLSVGVENVTNVWRVVVYDVTREYWPVRPPEGVRAPFLKPTKVERLPQESSKEIAGVIPSPAALAANEEILFRIVGDKSPAKVLYSGELKTDAQGKLAFDLGPYAALADDDKNVKETATVQFRAKNEYKEESSAWSSVTLKRDELVRIFEWKTRNRLSTTNPGK